MPFPMLQRNKHCICELRAIFVKPPRGVNSFQTPNLPSQIFLSIPVLLGLFTPTPIPNFIREEKGKRDGFFYCSGVEETSLQQLFYAGFRKFLPFLINIAEKGFAKTVQLRSCSKGRNCRRKMGKKTEKKSYHGREMKWV